MSITIEGVGDFLGKAGTIKHFVMEEKVGGDVPAFEFAFSTANASVIQQLNEGANVQIVYGKDMLNYKYAQMQVQKFNHHVDDSEFVHVNVKGIIMNGINYLKENEQKSFPKKKSIDVLKETAGKYFEVVDWMSEQPDDEMTWLRPNFTPYKFIQDTWKRSYINDDNAMVIAVEMSGKFLLTDIKMIAQQPTKWWLKQYPLDEVRPMTAAFNPNYEISSDFGLLNNMITNTKVTPIHSSNDEQSKEVETPSISPLLVAGNINRMKDAPKKTEFEKTIDTDNFHDNYSKARLVNVSKTAMVNSLELNITIENKWQDYLLLDKIHFTPFSSNQKMQVSQMGSVGGEYVITRISRFFADQRAVIMITISRDGMNNMSGGWF